MNGNIDDKDNNLLEDVIRRAIESRIFRKSIVAKSHYLFGKVYFSEAMYDTSAEFQKEMFSLAEKESRPLVVTAFRGSGKSLIFTQSYPLYAIMTQGIHFITIFSATQQQVQQHLANIRDSLENNSLLKKDFGPFKEETDEWGRNSLVIPRYDAKIMAISMEQTVRGLKYKHWRPQIILADDIEDTNSIRTQEGRDKTFHRLQSEIIHLGGPGARLIIVGNLLHPDSTIMRFKKAIETGQMKGVFRKYPLKDDDGKILWPERFTPEVIAEERNKFMDDIDWEREMNLNFISAQYTVVKREWIPYYEKFPDGGYVSKFVIGVDPAISKSQTADYTAIVSVIVCNSGEATKLFVYPNPFNRKVNFSETIEEIKLRYENLTMNMRYVEVFIEDVAYQAALPQYLNSIGNMRVKGLKVPMDKRSKFSVLGDLIKQGKIVFPKTGCELLIEQLVGFGQELHDDIADALALIAFAVFPDLYKKYTIPSKPWDGDESELMSREEWEREADRQAIEEGERQRGYDRHNPHGRSGGFVW